METLIYDHLSVVHPDELQEREEFQNMNEGMNKK